ncbi:MAG: dihydrolipoamide acetyltransferase family protein [Desulfomonilaceae bacterium]
MPIEILMPKLGLTMAEGLILEWKIKEGDHVEAGDVIFVLETEKVTYDVQAQENGLLAKILIQAGETVPVGTVVALMLRPGETADAISKESSPSEPCPPEMVAPLSVETEDIVLSRKLARIKATPLAKKLAREHEVDLSIVVGSGPSGRIVADDVRKAVISGTSITVQEKASIGEDLGRLVPFTGMRKAVANNMLFSKTQTAQTYMSLTANASTIRQHRHRLLPYIEKRFGVRLTITDLMMKVTGAAVAAHPVMNTRWTEEGVLFLPVVHIGMAMALAEGLVVPVIRDINSKGLGDIALERTKLIEKGKTNRLLPDDIKGSTFTVSSLGMFGIESFTANINQPENAILAVGAIIDMPVVEEGQIVIRPMMNITLSYDHRTIDGAEAAKFMQTLKAFLEEPILTLV